MKKSSEPVNLEKFKNHFIHSLKAFCFIFFILTVSNAAAQNLPPASSCTSKDLELVSATLPPPGGNPCACSGTRTLMLAIKNKTGSTRTSFAFWGTLKRYNSAGTLISSTAVTGCNGPIAKNTSPNPFTITTLPFIPITIACDETLELTDLFLAWTSSNNNEICPLNPSTINPKCGILPSIQIVAGVDASFSVVSATCSNGTSSITTTPFGGKAPYSYSWTASNGGTIPSGQSDDKDLIGLTPGTYTLVITDADGCTATRSRVITNPSALAVGTCTKTDVTCFGGSNGSVTAGAVTNNVGTINYSWKNAANVVVGTTAVVNNLPAGTYTLTVTDDCGTVNCNVTIGGPAAALALGTCTKTDVSCYGASDGSVSAGAVTNNVGAIVYSWKNASNVVVGNSATVNNLPAGPYTLTVNDNCSNRTCTVTIGGPTAALALGTCTKTDVTCYGASDGSVSAGAVTNNVGTIVYSWKNASNSVVGTSATVNNLPAGTYTLTVNDDCFTRTCPVTIGGPAAALALGTCTKTDVSCYGASDGSVSAGAVTNSVGTIIYSWKNASDVVVGNTATVNNLPAGSYILTVNDNCFNRTCTLTIGGPAAALALGTCSKTDATCTTNGSVSAGAVTNNVGTVHYSWKNSADVVVGTTANVSDLPAGVYTLTVNDNCFNRTCSVTIAAPDPINPPTVELTQPTLCGSLGSATITSPAPGDDILFSIDDGATWQESNVFLNLGIGSVTGVRVMIGDCISEAATLPGSDCAPQERIASSTVTGPATALVPVPPVSKTTPAKTQTEAPSASSVVAYPNPFNDRVKFVVTVPQAGQGTLELMNMQGQRIKTIYSGQIAKGGQIFEMEVPALRNNTLIYVFRMGGKQITGKLVQLNQ
jgi:SprB repeat